MKKQRLIGALNKQKYTLLIAILAIWCFGTATLAQNVRDTDHMADRNLKSSARVNPATLAMEFSLPLAVYPGRAGNSDPVALNYSSKIWTMRGESTRKEKGGWGTQLEPFLFTTYSSFYPGYSERTLAGWTSSLQPLSVLSAFDFYNDTIIGSPSSSNQLNAPTSETECTLTGATWDFDDPACPYGRFYDEFVCHEAEAANAPTSDPIPHSICFTSPWGGGGPNPIPGREPAPAPEEEHRTPVLMVKRVTMAMPDGSTKEFRKDDKFYNCDIFSNCDDNGQGTYISVDGSGMRLVRGEDFGNNVRKDVLYLPSGSRYIMGGGSQEFIDRNGNKSVYDATLKTWTNTLGQVIASPLPEAQTLYGSTTGTYQETFQLPALEGGQARSVTQKWQLLKPDGCITGSESACNNAALENPQDELYHLGTDTCENQDGDNPISSPSLFTADPTDTPAPIVTANNKWYKYTNKFRVCSGAGIFNPIVLSEVIQPDGSKYQFKYNRYGEITKIIYPTGAYERFRYDQVQAIGATLDAPYSQTNRGVVEHWISEDGTNISQHWRYNLKPGGQSMVNTTIAPDGTKTESISLVNGFGFGFEDPRTGKTVEERVYSKRSDSATNPSVDPFTDANDNQYRTLLRRNLTDWVDTASRNADNPKARRNPRAIKSVSIVIEGDKALATLSKTTYDESSSTDPENFSDLNPKQLRSYHYKVLTVSEAQTADIETIARKFTDSDLATISENDYSYDPNYKARGFTSLPTETRVLNPANPTDPDDVLARTQSVFDEADRFEADSGALSGAAANTWINPATDTTILANSRALRGNLTTSKVWDKENGTWIKTHTKYDQYGNPRKVWDATGDETRFVETVYENTVEKPYQCAFPTKIIAPAPDPNDTGYGTNLTSKAETTYDFKTGLPLEVKNDFDLVTKTEYDGMLRPFKTSAVNFTAPVSETEYGAPDNAGKLTDARRFVKGRKQVDASSNWEEATTKFDGLGRTYKTETKDSQGDVIVETKYDRMGRVEMVSNPYRAGETVLWNLTEYDALGRVKQTRAPVANQNPVTPTGDILGTMSYEISTVAGFVGTVVTTTDAAGKKSRSITNALGQVIRVDEDKPLNGTDPAGLGTLDAPLQPTFYKYDVKGKMVKVQQGKTGDPTIQNRYFLYDSLGRLIKVRQPEQQVNPSLATTGNPDNNEWTAAFTYDALGNLKTTIDAKGTIITNDYDKAGRVIKRAYSNEPAGVSTPAVDFYYDGKGLDLNQVQTPNYAKGKLTKVANSISQTRYTVFDNLGRVKATEQRTPLDGQTIAQAEPRTSTYKYNFAGALEEETYPSGRVVKNAFEADGDLMRISSKATAFTTERTYADSFAYTPAGAIERLQLGNGRWENAKFNTRLQITELGLGTSATNLNLWKVNYDYGELAANGVDVTASQNTGNIAKQTISFQGLANPFVQTYRYDSLNRLSEAKEMSGINQTWKQVWKYDRYGNRERVGSLQQIGNISSPLTPQNNLTFPTIDANTNRFSDNQGYGYDANGNVINDASADGTRNFTFDGDNKQTEVKLSGNLLSKYFYDGEGKRVKKHVYEPGNSVPTETTVFVYSGGKLIAEYTTAPLPDVRTTSYLTTDHLGSPRAISNTNGDVTSRRDFMPFGEELLNDGQYRTTNNKYLLTNDGIRQKFTGYEKDEETKLDFAEARYYNNQHGRFTAVDPLLASGKSANPQTFNRYAYTGNNPVQRTDPSGKDWIVVVEMQKVKGKKVSVERPFWVPSGDAGSDIPRADPIWQSNLPGEEGFQALHPTQNTISGVFKTRAEAQAQYDSWYEESIPDTKLEIMVYESTLFSGANGSELKGVVGHVAWGINDKTYSWDNHGYAASSANFPKFTDYLDYNATYRTGNLYELNFGSKQNNQMAAEEIMKGPRNASGIRFFGSGYNMATNNCGETLCRVTERLNLPLDDRIIPGRHRAFIESNLSSYIRSHRRFGPGTTNRNSFPNVNNNFYDPYNNY